MEISGNIRGIAYEAACAYAQCPGVNKNDPAAFGKAVRQVYEAALVTPTDPVDVRYNNPLVPPIQAYGQMAQGVSAELSKETLKTGDLLKATKALPAMVFVKSNYYTSAGLQRILDGLINSCTEYSNG